MCAASSVLILRLQFGVPAASDIVNMLSEKQMEDLVCAQSGSQHLDSMIHSLMICSSFGASRFAGSKKSVSALRENYYFSAVGHT